MDWPLAISRNRDALRRIVAGLFALAGLQAGGALSVLPRHMLAAILLVLRPAESAVRRLILIAALCGKAASTPLANRTADAAFLARLRDLRPQLQALRKPAFALLDTLKFFDPDEIWNVDPASAIRFESGFDAGLDPASGFRILPDGREPVPAAAILQRLNAIHRALETLPAQVRRLARWQARRELLLKARRPTRMSVIRPGLPPGWRGRRIHEIDDVLRECHGLALDRMNAPDSS